MRKPPSEALNERSRIVGFNGATLTKLERSVSKGNVYGKTFLFRDGDSIAGSTKDEKSSTKRRRKKITKNRRIIRQFFDLILRRRRLF